MWPSPVFACHGWYRSTKLCKRQLVSSWSCTRWSIISYISLGCTLPTLLTLLITSRWWPQTWSGRTNVRFCKASPHADQTRPRLLIRQRKFLQVRLLIVASCCLSECENRHGDAFTSSLVYWSGSSQSMVCVTSLLPSRLNIPPSVSGVDGKLTLSLWCLVFQHVPRLELCDALLLVGIPLLGWGGGLKLFIILSSWRI